MLAFVFCSWTCCMFLVSFSRSSLHVGNSSYVQITEKRWKTGSQRWRRSRAGSTLRLGEEALPFCRPPPCILPSECPPCWAVTVWSSLSQRAPCKLKACCSSLGHRAVTLSDFLLNLVQVTMFREVRGVPHLCHLCSLFAAYPVQHGPLLRDAQLVRLLPREAHLLQCVPRGSVWGHVPRTVLWRYERCVSRWEKWPEVWHDKALGIQAQSPQVSQE